MMGGWTRKKKEKRWTASDSAYRKMFMGMGCDTSVIQSAIKEGGRGGGLIFNKRMDLWSAGADLKK